jgi:hypothetical protein
LFFSWCTGWHSKLKISVWFFSGTGGNLHREPCACAKSRPDNYCHHRAKPDRGTPNNNGVGHLVVQSIRPTKKRSYKFPDCHNHLKGCFTDANGQHTNKYCIGKFRFKRKNKQTSTIATVPPALCQNFRCCSGASLFLTPQVFPPPFAHRFHFLLDFLNSSEPDLRVGGGVWFQVSIRIFHTSPSRRSCGSGVFGYWAFFRGSSAGLMKVISNGPVKLS